MAGNTINMYGGSYVDVHDNESVTLNIEKATVSVSDGGCKTEDVREQASVLTSNGEFMAILAKAEEKGFCLREGWRYRWRVKAEAAYFASLASQQFGLSDRHDHDGDLAFSWKPFEALFGTEKLRLTYNDIKQCKSAVRRKAKIDNLFR